MGYSLLKCGASQTGGVAITAALHTHVFPQTQERTEEVYNTTLGTGSDGKVDRQRERIVPKTGETTREVAYCLENVSLCCRDATLGEDASGVRKGHAPANNAILNNIALAIVFHRGFRPRPEANLHFMMRPATPSGPASRRALHFPGRTEPRESLFQSVA